MTSVGVNPPKTPVTAASHGISVATTPNVCKMPGPPAPFVPTPLPNIGRSGDQPGDYTGTVLIEGAKVAVRGSYFKSKGDMASQGTGGGLISQATHGKTEFVAPGSMNVLAEGKGIQLLGDFMTNNGSNPGNSATPKEAQAPAPPTLAERKLQEIACACERSTPPERPTETCESIGERKHKCCEAAIAAHKGPPSLGGERGYDAEGKKLTKSRDQMKADGDDLTGSSWPDACSLDSSGNPDQFFDFKFTCPKGHPYLENGKLALHKSGSNKGALKLSTGKNSAYLNFYQSKKGKPSQFKKYQALGEKLTPKIKRDPRPISNDACR